MGKIGYKLAETPVGHADNILRHVLVVDDGNAQRCTIATLLRGWGYLVHEACSAAEALAFCRKAQVDLVLADWNLSDLTGIEFCRAFRELQRDGYALFVFVTNRGDSAAGAKGLEAGADDFVTKPVNPAELHARISAGARILRMERDLKTRNRMVTETLARLQEVHDSLDRDLSQARMLQQSLLRERCRDFGAARASLLLRPCGHVGGDLVGVFSIDPRRIGLFSLDVSGHGVASALMAARLAGQFSGTCPDQNIGFELCDNGLFEPRAPLAVAQKLNRMMLREFDTGLYCTFTYGDLDLASGRLRMVQAGHPHPVVLRADGAIERLGEGGNPVGLIADAEFSAVETLLRPGDRLFVMSDGITDCPDRLGRPLGEDGVAALLRKVASPNETAFADLLIWELSEHAGSTEFADDISAVMLKFVGTPAT